MGMRCAQPEPPPACSVPSQPAPNRYSAVAHSHGDHAIAIAQLGLALKLAREHGDRLAEAEALRVLAEAERAAHRPARALTHLEEARTIVRELGHPWATAEVERDLGALYRTLDRTGAAADAFRAAQAFAELGATSRAHAMRQRAAPEPDA